MLLSPCARYQADLAKPGFTRDSAQQAAVARLEQLYEQLTTPLPTKTRWWHRWKSAVPAHESIKGVYLWGGVGRGKTYVMDLFYESLAMPQKMRTHFHRFMRRVHAELNDLKGQKNPLQMVADRLAQEAKVICFDEFFVSDITDAMILANLLEALFARGVTLVATSNLAPQDLYKDGLQRVRFLPAIDLLYKHLDVLELDGGVDFRLRALTQAQLYYCPLGVDADQALQNRFGDLVRDQQSVRVDTVLTIEGRDITARREAGDVCWFDFASLCEGPRSQRDYLELAREYHTVLISNVPVMGSSNDDAARRFIYLVDVFYDSHVKLIISAAAPLRSLYDCGRLEFEFQRTVSRLMEMQSQEYLALPHLGGI